MNAIKIWGVAYKGEQSGVSADDLPLLKIIGSYSADCCLIIGQQLDRFEWHILQIEVGWLSADHRLIIGWLWTDRRLTPNQLPRPKDRLPIEKKYNCITHLYFWDMFYSEAYYQGNGESTNSTTHIRWKCIYNTAKAYVNQSVCLTLPKQNSAKQ